MACPAGMFFSLRPIPVWRPVAPRSLVSVPVLPLASSGCLFPCLTRRRPLMGYPGAAFRNLALISTLPTTISAFVAIIASFLATISTFVVVIIRLPATIFETARHAARPVPFRLNYVCVRLCRNRGGRKIFCHFFCVVFYFH